VVGVQPASVGLVDELGFIVGLVISFTLSLLDSVESQLPKQLPMRRVTLELRPKRDLVRGALSAHEDAVATCLAAHSPALNRLLRRARPERATRPVDLLWGAKTRCGLREICDLQAGR
jgi:hypothetical protein